MDRRATLNALLGRKKEYSVFNLEMNNLNSGLEPYEGEWTFQQAAHLLKRTTFAPNRQSIKEAIEMGLDTTLNQLFDDLPLPSPPLNYDNNRDTNVPIGETWINAPNSPDINLRGYRTRSLRAWMWGQILKEDISIREKLTLFWHNHFALNNIQEPRFLYTYITLLRENAWGNFRDLVKEITIDPSMLRFLNGRQNSLRAPNENYARELLELFTIGKGDLVGPGDYSTFTEEDVKEIARALTGWRDTGYAGRENNLEVGAYFTLGRHDKEEKQLSHRFNNVVIPNLAENEYSHVVDLIFQQDEVARHISRKLYRWFVFYQIDESVEASIIEPMAQILIENDYEIKPALTTLLRSQHFFDFALKGGMIKNPMDFTLSVFKQLDFPNPEDFQSSYIIWYGLDQLASLQQMQYFNPPDVAGWKAYYQEPLYYRTWINATTFTQRMKLSDFAITFGYKIRGGFEFDFPALEYIEKLDNPSDPNDLINETAALLFPMPITEEQLAALKEILIPGLPDFEWTVEYLQYREDPENSDLRQIIENKIRSLIKTMCSMAEFNLI